MQALSIPLALLGILMTADMLFTMQFVSVLGLDAEANPIMRWVIETGGFGLMALVKAVVFAAACWVFVIYNRTRPTRTLIIAWVLCAIHIPIVIAGWMMIP